MARGGASSAGELRTNPGRGRSRTQLPHSQALGPRQLPGDCHGHTTDDSNSLDSKPGIGCLRPLPSLNPLRRETVLPTRSQVPMQTRCTRYLAKDWKCSPHVLRGAPIGVCCLHDAHLRHGPRMLSALLKHAAKNAALVYSSQAVNSAAADEAGLQENVVGSMGPARCSRIAHLQLRARLPQIGNQHLDKPRSQHCYPAIRQTSTNATQRSIASGKWAVR